MLDSFLFVENRLSSCFRLIHIHISSHMLLQGATFSDFQDGGWQKV